MAYTISTHNGSQVARLHNLRNEKVVSKEAHINNNGIHETWLDIKPEDAYDRLFGEAVKEYNDRQIKKGHAERQIKNYYDKICSDRQKHPVYELIISVGSYDNHPDTETSKKILKEFCKSWKTRNPNLIMIGCYYHADELSSFQNPNNAHGHVHIDYIPVANNLSRGMKRQNSLVKALNEMKFETTSIHDTAQIRWQRAQNIELERICVAHGLEIEHPSREKQKHLDIKEYRQRKRIEDLEKQNAALIDKINTLIDYHNELNRTIDSLELGASELAHEIVENQFNIDRDNLIR